MPWDVTHNPADNVVEVSYSGDVTKEDLKAATLERASLQKAIDTNSIITDVSAVDSFTDGVFSILSVPNEVYRGEKFSRSTRIGVILPKSEGLRDDAIFYQTASKNRGWQVEVFEDPNDALAWLNDSD